MVRACRKSGITVLMEISPLENVGRREMIKEEISRRKTGMMDNTRKGKMKIEEHQGERRKYKKMHRK
jgi:hypothetical protein